MMMISESSNGVQPVISDREFRLIAGLLDDVFGIHLEDSKKSLVISRLGSTIKKKGFETFGEYYNFVRKDPSGAELLTFVDRISTNHSFFFREAEHFEFLKKVLPYLVNSPSVRSRGQLTLWSAGCSSGEEPYTLAMVLKEMEGTVLKGLRVRILATDISHSVLMEAGRGEYNKDKLKLVPRYFLSRYFYKTGVDQYTVTDNIRDMVMFKSLNLMRDTFPFKNKFDVIFCRNVMIYFSGATREKLVSKFISVLNPGGFLFIGHSETFGRNYPNLKYIEPAVYRYD